MYYKAFDAACTPKTWNISDDLGQIEYIFSDKTGTLTKGVFEVVDIHHSEMEREKLLDLAAHAESASSHPIARSLARAYGTRARDIVGTARSMADLGEAFDGGLTAAEVDYLRTEEWAVTAEDILWRRSKLGLRTSAESAARLAAYLDRRAEAA